MALPAGATYVLDWHLEVGAGGIAAHLRLPAFGDPRCLLPDSVRSWALCSQRRLLELKTKIVDRRVVLKDHSYRHRAKSEIRVTLGDIHVAGIPFADYSTYGSHRGLGVPTVILVFVWVRLIHLHLPMFLVIEKVVPLLTNYFRFCDTAAFYFFD